MIRSVYAAGGPLDFTNVSSSTRPSEVVAKIYAGGLYLVGGTALLFIIYGGYLVMSSQGNPDQLNKGKGYIVYSIIGLLLAIFGFVFYQAIVQNVLGLNQLR